MLLQLHTAFAYSSRHPQTGVPKDQPMSQLVKTNASLPISPRSTVSASALLLSVRSSRRLARLLLSRSGNTIEIGNEYDGTVKSLTSYGAFVDIGGVDGMVHISELSWGRIKHPSEVVSVGDKVKVFVIVWIRKIRRSPRLQARGGQSVERIQVRVHCDIGSVAGLILKFMRRRPFAGDRTGR